MKRQSDWPALLLFIAILFGGLVRFMPAVLTHFPINDGGMFYTMTRELSLNGYALPVTTAYNGFDLPYAYPPLGFYLASFLADFGRVPLIEVFLWLPPFLATLAIPAFYRLARALLTDNLRASLAALFFAITPGSYDWHIMGGGITRAAGMLFSLLAAFYVLRLFQKSGLRGESHFVFAILFCSLAVLSHPEVGLQTAGLCAILWLFFGRTWLSTLHAFLISMGVLLLTAPWWGTVIAAHGLTPFLSAVQTGQHTSVAWLSLLTGLFTSGEFLPLLLILRVAGFFYALWKREYFLVVILFTPALVDPRSATFIANLSLGMLAAFGFLDVVPALNLKLRGVEMKQVLNYRAGAIALLILALTLFIECGLLNFRLVNTTLTADERATITWIRENLPPDQDFLLITGRQYSMSDPVQEWFPTLGGQHSQTTLQGLEWTLAGQFEARLNNLVFLQFCADIACVEAWSARTGLGYNYIWLGKATNLVTEGTAQSLQNLRLDLGNSPTYRLVHESGSAAIFQRLIP
jgi:hypothetical protein